MKKILLVFTLILYTSPLYARFDNNFKFKICAFALSKVNLNPPEQYSKVKIEENKITIKSSETGYEYECSYISDNKFVLSGYGWENMLPNGNIITTSENCVSVKIYDPGFNHIIKETVCNNDI